MMKGTNDIFIFSVILFEIKDQIFYVTFAEQRWRSKADCWALYYVPHTYMLPI